MKTGSILNYEKIGKPIGRGSQGEVWKVIKNRQIALKSIRATHGSAKYENAKSEIDKLELVTKDGCHPNIVCYYDHYYDNLNDYILIEMELIEGETLEKYSKRYRKEGDMDKLYRKILLVLKDLIKGIKHIHSKGIIHNDIKTDNIMIDKSLTPKLIDFGLACRADRKCKLGKHKNTMCCGGFDGTFTFASPEMFKEPYMRYPQSDVWSLGVTLYRAATGKYPFKFNEVTPSLRDVTQKIQEREPAKLNTTNKFLNKMVNSMLVKDPTKRITVDEIDGFMELYE